MQRLVDLRDICDFYPTTLRKKRKISKTNAKKDIREVPGIFSHTQAVAIDSLAGLSMGMVFPWESRGKCPMGWDGTARIAFPMGQ